MELVGAEELGRSLGKTRNCIYSEFSQRKPWTRFALHLGRRVMWDWETTEGCLRGFVAAEIAKLKADGEAGMKGSRLTTRPIGESVPLTPKTTISPSGALKSRASEAACHCHAPSRRPDYGGYNPCFLVDFPHWQPRRASRLRTLGDYRWVLPSCPLRAF